MREDNHISEKERKQIINQRKNIAKQARKYHKEQLKNEKKSISESKRPSASKIADAVNSRPNKRPLNLSREEQFRIESEQRIKNLRPKDYSDGYYIDEFGEKKRQEVRAKVIKQQEAEIIKKRKKPLSAKNLRFRRILVYSSICAVVIVIGLILSLTVLFKTEKIFVEGDKYYYEEQIIDFCGVKLQQNIFISAIASTPEKAEEYLPFVEEAKVSFSVPDTITIKIKNAVPTYVIRNGEGYLLISSKGRILDNISQNVDNLPELACEELKSTKIGDYVSFSDKNVTEILEEVSKCLVENEIENIRDFDVTDTANITLNYDNRIKINIGLPEDINYKIRTAITIINEKLDPNNTGAVKGTLDVSACNTTKMSHYKPDKEPSATVPKATTPTDSTVADDTSDYYNDSYDDGLNNNDGSYDSSLDSGEDSNYDDSYYDDGSDTYNDDSQIYYYDSSDDSSTDGQDYYDDSTDYTEANEDGAFLY